MIMTLKLRSALLVAASAFAFSGCLLDEPTLKAPAEAGNPPPVEVEDPPPTECASPLCRVETPADTSMLTPDQKEELITVIEAADDSAVVGVTAIELDALSDSIVTSEVLSVLEVLQIDALKDLRIPVDSVLSSGVSLDSLLSSVRVSFSSTTGTANLQWSGTIGDVQVDMVSLNVKDGEFLGGYAVVDGKVFSFMPLGGNLIAIVYDSNTMWMGECPPLPKTGGVQLTCANILP